jgi:holo-[acyl-carrier protein] synthase
MKRDLLLGIDCQSIDYFEKTSITENSKFYRKIFSKNEIEYSLSKARPAQHFAARFAAKEAVIKALSDLNIKPNQIKILNEDGGKPFIVLENGIAEKYDLKLSLTHCSNIAVAVVVGSQKNGLDEGI